MLFHGTSLCTRVCETERETEIIDNSFQKRASVSPLRVARRTSKGCLNHALAADSSLLEQEPSSDALTEQVISVSVVFASPCCMTNYNYTNLSCQSNEPCAVFVVLWPTRGWRRRGRLLGASPAPRLCSLCFGSTSQAASESGWLMFSVNAIPEVVPATAVFLSGFAGCR